MRHLLFTLIILSYVTLLSAQAPQVTLEDVLEFKVDTTSQKTAGWYAASFTGNIRSREEIDTLKSDKSVVIFHSPATETAKSSYHLATGFLMPTIDRCHEIEASFRCKNQGFDVIQLIFTGYDAAGNKVSIDTLKSEVTDDWQESITTVSIEKVSYMQLMLEIEGNVPNIDKTLWVDNIQLKADGINLTEYTPRNLAKESVFEIDKMAKLSFEDSTTYKQIQLLASKKMVTLGESLHGSETLSESVIQIMKHRILNNNCKLILLETPLETSLGINRFVQGDERFDLDVLIKSLEFSLYSQKMLDFLVWLRAHNQQTTHKVFVFGMDAPGSDFNLFATELFDYFYRMNKIRINDSIKKFLELVLIDSRKAMGPLFSSLKEDADFKSNCDSLEIKIIEHWWNDWLKVKPGDKMDVVRDSIMYSSAKFITNLVCTPSETVTLYSHLEHGCFDKTHTISYYPPMSYGALLKKDFGDDYGTLGLFAYQGEVLSIPDQQQMHRVAYNFIKNDLKPATDNSLEHFLHQSNLDYAYIPVTSLPNTQWYIRIATNAKQFVNIIHPSHYMDGGIYVKESKAMQVVNQDVSLIVKYQNARKRFEKYLTLIK